MKVARTTKSNQVASIVVGVGDSPVVFDMVNTKPMVFAKTAKPTLMMIPGEDFVSHTNAQRIFSGTILFPTRRTDGIGRANFALSTDNAQSTSASLLTSFLRLLRYSIEALSTPALTRFCGCNSAISTDTLLNKPMGPFAPLESTRIAPDKAWWRRMQAAINAKVRCFAVLVKFLVVCQFRFAVAFIFGHTASWSTT